MRTPKLNALKVFDAAARALNFRIAAGELNVTQGAVAQTIRGVEADLGVRLFKRMARGVALTEVGKKYHHEVSQGLAIIDQATERLHSRSDTITVSVPPSFASKWLVPRLPYFFEANPEIKIRTIASEVLTDLHKQDVDVAVRQGNMPTDGGLYLALLASNQLCIICGPKYASELAMNTDWELFSTLPLIQDSHRLWENLFGEHGIKPLNHIQQFNQTALAMDAAANDQGYAIVPRMLALDDLSSGRLIEVWTDDRETETGFWLVHLDDDPPNSKARSLFVDWMRSEAQDN